MPYGLQDFAFLFVGGRDLLASVVTSAEETTECETEETTGAGPVHGVWRTSKPIGIRGGSISHTGLFDDATDGINQALNGQQLTSQVVMYALAGGTIGKMLVCLAGALGAKYKRNPLRGLLKGSCEYTVSGNKDEAKILHGKTAETGATWHTEASSLDSSTVPDVVIPIVSISEAAAAVVVTGAPHGRTSGDKVLIADVVGSSPNVNGDHVITVLSTTSFSIPIDTSAGDGGSGGTYVVTKTQNGGAGCIAVPALTLGGYTNAAVKIRHSADNAAWADLISFTAITAAPATERKTVTGTINRYWSTSGAYSGAGTGQSITPVIGFARG